MVDTVDAAPTQVPDGSTLDSGGLVAIGACIIDGSLAGLKAALAVQLLQQAPGMASATARRRVPPLLAAI
ncbi:MAG: hypothetical protein PVJ47_05385 [Thiohalocapsa sp.]|jgi:hypothetical protein